MALGPDHPQGLTRRYALPGLVMLATEWLSGLITRRVPLARWMDALARQPDDIKVVVDLAT